MENINNLTVEALCAIIKQFGSFSLSVLKNEHYSFEIKTSDSIPEYTKRVSKPEIEQAVRKWCIEKNFKLDKGVKSDVYDTYFLSNIKTIKDRASMVNIYEEPENEVLPHDVSFIQVTLPGNDFERVFGKDRPCNDLNIISLGGTKYLFYPFEKTITFELYMKDKKDL